MNDIQVNISEHALQVAFESVRTRLNSLLNIDGEVVFGPITLGYKMQLALAGGSLTLNNNGEIVIREMDIHWPGLKLRVAVNLPSIPVTLPIPPLGILPGDVLIPPGHGIMINHTFFDSNMDLTGALDITPPVTSEISVIGSLAVERGSKSWQCRLKIQRLDFDLFDIEALFPNINDLIASSFQTPLDNLLNTEMEELIGEVTFVPPYLSDNLDEAARKELRDLWAGWANIPAVLQNSLGFSSWSFTEVVARATELGDDFGEWLADKLLGPIGLKNLIMTRVANRLAEEFVIELISDPVVLLPAEPARRLGAVRIDVADVRSNIDSEAIALAVDFA